MIWFQLALLVVSFLITALLAPKPDIENARASTLDDVNFPQASENAPLAIVLGNVRLNGPNTIWYGGFRTEEITERIRISLFKKETIVVGYRYFLTMDMGLCLGPNVSLRKVYIDEELVWAGNTNGAVQTNISIVAPELFGGYKEGGGWVSNGFFYNGSFSQPIDPAVDALVSGPVPAYRGTSHIVFNDAYIGESAQLRRIAFELEQYTNALSLPLIGIDINPAEALWQILTDDWYGLDVNPGTLNVTSFATAGATLNTEANGCSVLVTADSAGNRLVTELLRQIDGIMYQDPTTGLIQLELIREDYVIGDLPVLDETDIVTVKSFTKTTWDEVFAQTKVQFPQRDSESSAIAVSQDMATFNTIGTLKTQTLSFPFVYDRNLANRIASRERAQSSVPLFRATIEVNRNAYFLRPGSVFIFSFDEYQINQLIMRVQRFDLGSLLEGRMVVEAIQDNFAVADTVFAAPESSSWVNVVYGPQDIVDRIFIQTPRFFAAKGEEAIPSDRYGITPIAAKPGAESSNYTMHVQTPADATVDDGTTEPTNVIYHGSGLLTTEYSRDEGFVTGQDTTVGLALNSVLGDFLNYTESGIRDEYFGLIYVGGEFMAYETATDLGSGNWTITNVWRGLLGTRPQTHAVGSRVYSVDSAAFGRGIEDFPPDGSVQNLRLLDVSAGITQDPNYQTAIPFTVAGAADNVNSAPIRPGNLELGGVRELNPTIADQVDRTLTWVPRSFDGQRIAFETDSAETLPYLESYTIDFLVDGVVEPALSGTVAAGVTSFNVPFSLTGISSTDVEIRVTPRDETNNVNGLEYSYYGLIMAQVVTAGIIQVTSIGSYASSSGQPGNISATLDVPYPADIEAGDLLMLNVTSQDALTVPAGWTQNVNRTTTGTDDNDTTTLYRIATGTETGSLTITQASAQRFWAQMVSHRSDFGTPSFANFNYGTYFTPNGQDTVVADGYAVEYDSTIVWSIASYSEVLDSSQTVSVVPAAFQITTDNPVARNGFAAAWREQDAAATEANITWDFAQANSSGSAVESPWITEFLNGPIDSVLRIALGAGAIWRFTAATNFTDAAGNTPVASNNDAIQLSNDIHGQENATQATALDRPAWQSGNLSALFDGVTDHLITAETTNAAAGTLIARVRADAGSTGVQTIIGSFPGGSVNAYLSVDDGVPSAGIGSQDSATITGGVDIRSATNFHVLAVTWDGSNVRLYADGVEVYSGAQAGTVSSAAAYIGARNNNGTDGAHFNGEISEVAVYDAAITARQVNQVTRYWNFLHGQ